MSTVSTHKKPKALGLISLTALVAGNMIGSGVFLLPASLAQIGTISLVTWIFTGLGAMALAYVFAAMSQRIPETGGPYIYCRRVFGEWTGFQVAYNYWVALWVGNAAIAVALVGYLSYFFPSLAASNLKGLLVTLLAVWAFTAINIWNIRHVAFFQVISTFLKLLPLIFMATIGYFYVHPALWFHDVNITGQSNWHAINAAGTLTLWAFIGLESATVPAEHVSNPSKTIYRATLLGVLITAIIYILSSAAIMGIIPIDQLKNSEAPFAEAARMILGPVGGDLIAIGAIISCLGALNGWVLLQGQIGVAAARDHLFPSAFAKMSPQGTPVYGLIISSILISILLMMRFSHGLVNTFTFVILLATLASLLPYMLTAIAQCILLKKEKPFKHYGALSITLFAIAYVTWAIIGTDNDVLLYGFFLLLSGFALSGIRAIYARKKAK